MDNNNSRPSVPKIEPAMDTGDWIDHLPRCLVSQQISLHQQPLGTQRSVAGLQPPPQQHLFSSQVHMLLQPTAGLQRTHQAGHGLFSFQGQQSQNQQLQQPNLLQQDLQQRLPPQNVYQSQRTLPEMLSSSLDSSAQVQSANGVYWREEAYKQIRVMNEKYLSDIHDIYERVTAKLERQYSLPQQQRVKDFEKMKMFKTMLERMIRFLLLSKSNIMPALKDNLASYETKIINFLNVHRPRKQVQQGQLPQPQMQPMQQQSSQKGNVAINIVDWRTQHPPASRQKNVNTLMETLKKHVPYSGKEGIEELMRIAISYDELIFNTTRNQVDYLSKISLKMQSMEEGSQVKQEEFSKRFKTF